MFLRGSVRSRAAGVFLFCLFVSFETGFSNLLYFRTLYLLPYVVVYLNSLEEMAVAKRRVIPPLSLGPRTVRAS
jgi:hypothetical protein